MSTVLVTSTEADAARVGVLTHALQADGAKVNWITTPDGEARDGAANAEALEQSIADADVVLTVWSQNARKDHWVREAAYEALSQDKLIPIAMDRVAPPFGLRTVPAENFVGWTGDTQADNYRRLKLMIDGAAPRPGDADAPTPAKPGKSRGVSIWFAIVIAVLAWIGLAALDEFVPSAQDAAVSILSGWGLLGGAVMLASAFFVLFQAADAQLPEHLKALVRRWLIPVKGGVRVSVAETFNQAFEAVFGRRHVSFKCLWRSAAASTLAFVLIMGFAWLFAPEFQRVFDGAWSPIVRNVLIMTLITNVIGDYVSLGQTRVFLRWAVRAPLLLPVLAILDLVFTLAVYLAVTYASYVALEPLFAFGSQMEKAWWEAPSAQAYFLSLLPASPDPARWLPVHWVFAASILTTFITSVWLWLVLVFGPIARLVTARSGEATALGRALSVAQRPMTVVGLIVAGMIVAAGGALSLAPIDVTARAIAVRTDAPERLADLAVFQECEACPEMVILPAGAFTMGSPDNEAGRINTEGPQRTVTIGERFAVGRYEVTWREWQACVADGGCDDTQVEASGGDEEWGRGAHPVINVSWHDAQAYAAWLNTKVAGEPYRLLTEAEWEYAARAGTITAYAFGETIRPDQANFASADRNLARTTPVGVYPPNAWGLYDMHGNVYEWVEDCYGDYAAAPVDGRAAQGDPNCARVLRGGSWGVDPQFLRSANRGGHDADNRSVSVGFRLARVISR